MISRIKEVIAHYKLTDRAFAIKCGIKQNTLSRQLNGVSETVYQQLMQYWITTMIYQPSGYFVGKVKCLFQRINQKTKIQNVFPD